MKLTTFTALAMLLSVGYAFAGAGAPEQPGSSTKGQVWYVAADVTSGKCEMMTTTPDATKYKLKGTFKTKEEAQAGMAGMKDCK
jgi:hypothetical protein